jgi:hypothetical protein
MIGKGAVVRNLTESVSTDKTAVALSKVDQSVSITEVKRPAGSCSKGHHERRTAATNNNTNVQWHPISNCSMLSRQQDE